MFIFVIVFFVVNLLVTCGYSDLLRLTSDTRLHTYWIISTILILVVFFTVPTIMVNFIIGVLTYVAVGLLLYLLQCKQYLKKREIDRESW